MNKQMPDRSKFASMLRRRSPARRLHCGRGMADETGSGLLEMALVSVILLTMLFGLMEMCLALYTYHFISEAAREGSRFAIVRGSSCNYVNPSVTPCPASQAEIQTYVQNLNYPGINPQAETVTATWSPYPAGETCAPSPACDNPGNQVQVTVNYQYPLAIPFIPASILNMSSTSQMIISQ
jgi:Flp pilus assembly protein TadG